MENNWDLEWFTLYVEDIALPENAPGRSTSIRMQSMQEREPGVFASKPIKLRVGNHQLFLSEARFGIECEVTHADPQELTLSLPPRARLLVTVKDASTGQRIESASASYRYLGNQSSGGHGTTHTPSSAEGGIELNPPIGKISLEVSGGASTGYLPDYRPMDVFPGFQEITVELKCARSINIALREGERPVDCPMGMMNLKISDARGVVHPPTVRLDSSGKITILLPDAGTYVLALPALRGYLPIADIEVDLASQESADIVIQLVREQ
jgi:hypothetical protein